MKKILYLLALSFAALAVVSCGKNFKFSATDADEPDTPVWKMPTGQVELGTSDFETFDIAPDQGEFRERMRPDTARSEYVENTPFDDVVSIHFDGKKTSVKGDGPDFKVQTSGAHVTLTAGKRVRVELSGTTTDGSFTILGDNKVCIALRNLNLRNPKGPAISCLSKKDCFLVTDSLSTLSDDTLNRKTILPTRKVKPVVPGETAAVPAPAKGAAKSAKGAAKPAKTTKAAQAAKPTKTAKKGGAMAAQKTAKDDTVQQKGIVFTEGKLCISGVAPLKITSYGLDAIHSNKSIFVRRGTQLDIQSNGGDAISAKKNVRIEGGLINILSTAKCYSGISAKKLVEITGGRTTIINKGLGETKPRIPSGLKHSRGIKCDSLISISDAIVRIKDLNLAARGIASGHNIHIKNSIVDVLTLGKNDGWAKGSKVKGIRAVDSLMIDSSRIRVHCDREGFNEGLEGRKKVVLTGSLVELRTGDDCISVAEETGDLTINGGRLYGHAVLDAIDSNGTIHINDGLIFTHSERKGSRGFDCDFREFLVTPDAVVIGVGSCLSPFTEKLVKHPTVCSYVPNATPQFVVTPAGSDECLFGFSRPDLEYPDYDWLVLMSVPQFAEGSSIDICTKGQMTAPTNTFHGLQLGGKVSGKEVKNTVLLDRPFIKLKGGHPFFYKHVSKGA